MKPKEGTILTVAREAVEYAVERIPPRSTLRSFFADLVGEMHDSVDRTPEILSVLKEAGVVDSGGAGLVCFTEGMLAQLSGELASAVGNGGGFQRVSAGLVENNAAEAIVDGNGHHTCGAVAGTGHGYSVLDIVKAFEKACGKEIPYIIRERRPGDIATCYADPAKAKEELGWIAQRGLDEMCEDTWRWQSTNPNGYEA